MSWSDEDDDNEDAGQPMSGFVWGNIKPETGQLEDDDRQRYPEPFRDQVENDRVQALSHLARSRSESIPEDNIRIVPTQIYADYDVPELSSSDGEDYDDDGGGGGGNDRQARSSHEDFVLTKTDPKMPAGAASTSNDKSENDDQGNPEYEEFDADQVMVDPYNVLRKDENGEDILRFSSLFAPAILEVDPRQANQGVLIIKKQSHRVIEDDDCVQFQWRDKIDDTEVDEFVKSADKTIVYHEPHPLLTVGHKPERTAITVPELSSSLFALIEQTEWDNSILWEGNCDEPGPVVQEISLKPTTTSPLTASFPILVEGSTEHQLPECPKKVRAFSLHKRRRRRYEFHAEHIRQDSLPECWASDLEGKSQFRQPIAVNSHLPSRLLPNYDLESMHWLDDVIWDDDEGKVMPTRPVPVLLDMNDGAMVFDEGDDVDDTTTGQTASSMPSAERFNVSLDQGTLYASYRDDLGAVVGKTGLQHALFAKNLIEALFPTDRTPKQWSNWHRPKFDLRSALALRASSSKATATASQMGFGQQRKFVPRRLRDVSARDGQLVLVEYIEPEPLLIQTTGMATELVTFYRQRNSGDTWQPRPAHGTTRIVSADMDDETPFLGKIRPGFCITALNNNMFAVPLVLHESRTTDFILVLSSSNATAFTLHELPATYLAGQIQPKMEVPALNSRAASSFMKRRLTVYMHRLLQSAGALQIAEVFAAFPGQSETAIRAKLKEVAEFQRSGDLSGWWTPRTDKPPVRESALWEMVTPEAMCAYDRMEAGRQALKDGFGIELLATLTAAERVFIARMSSEHPLKRAALYIEQQTRMTPWNLSSNFLSAVKGVCLLRLKGPGNPIAPGAGLCYLRAPTRAEPDPIEEKLGPTSALTGTNKDLRKLDMNGLRDVLLSFGVPLERIVKLLRWERVDLVRLKATEAARDGQENEWSRFARSQRNTYRAQAAQFLKDAQRVLEKQVAFISSTTEPDVKPEDDEEIDEMEEWAKDLESMMESELKDDDAVEYDKWMKQKRNAEAPKEKIEEKTEKRKKTVLRRRLKKTVTTLNQTSGETLMTVTMIDDQALIDAFLNDRLKFDAICAERPVPVAKDKARLRLGNKKRRRGRPSAHEILPPRRTPTLPPPQSKRRGRPKGSKNQQPDTSVVVAPEALMVASAPVVGLEVPFIAAPSPVFRMPEVPEAEPSIPAAKLATAKKAITVRCSRCKQIGHTKSNSRCPLLSGSAANIPALPLTDNLTRHSPATAV